MSLVFVAAAGFHWGGHDYAAGDKIDTTGWTARAIEMLQSHSPVYVDTSATYAPAVRTKLFVVGHSVAASGGAPTADAAWQNLVAGMLGWEIVNFARGGAVVGWSESNVLPYGQLGDGGVGGVLSTVPFPTLYRPYKGAWASGTTYASGDIVWTGASLDSLSWWVSQVDSNTAHDPTTDSGTNWKALTASSVGHEYLPVGRFPVVEFGSNDLGWVGNLNAFLNAERVVLSALLAAEITARSQDPRCSFTAGFGGLANLGAGAGFGATVTNGTRVVPPNTADYEDIVTPADWPGGMVSVTYALVPPSAGGTFTAGTFGAQVDGATVLTKDVSADAVGPISTGKAGAFCLRFNVPAGAHHIRVQQTVAYAGSGGSIYTDALILEASPAPPGLVVGLHKFLNAAAYTATYGGGTTASDANVDAWNTALAAMVAAEFPSLAFALPSAISDHDATKFSQDGVHPNEHGHALLADDFFDAISVALASTSREMRTKISRPAKTGRRVRLDFGADNPANTISVGTTGWGELTYTSTLSGHTSGSRTIEASIAADVGDIIEIGLFGMWSNNASAIGNLDIVTVNWPNGTSQNAIWQNYVSTGGPTQAANGLPGGSALNAGVFAPLLPGGPLYYQVRPADMRLGNVTFRVLARAVTAARLINLSASNPLILCLANVGQRQIYEGVRSGR